MRDIRKWRCWAAALMFAPALAACAGSPTHKAASAPAAAKASALASSDGATLAAVKARGTLRCGINPGLGGFSVPLDNGSWSGFDIDYCHAVASAIFGDPEKVSFVPLSTEQRFTALLRGDVDLLARNSVATLSRDTQLSLEFAAINFFDGQGFLVRRAENVRSAAALSGRRICVLEGTTTEFNLLLFAEAQGLDLRAVRYRDADAVTEGYLSGACDAATADASYLTAIRAFLPDRAEHVILPERISKEPLALMVRAGDSPWADLVRWTHFALLTAEELGVTKSNAAQLRTTSADPDIQSLLGTSGHSGAAMGLGDDWAFNVIRAVGNYAEIYDRNLGKQSPLGMERGPNALWRDGGLQFAAPFR